MDLDTSAVELDLERHRLKRCQRVFDVIGGSREHRLHRPQNFDLEALEPRRTVRHQRPCNETEVGGEHQRAAYVRGRKLGCLGHGFDHDPFERPVAYFANEQASDEVLFRLRRFAVELETDKVTRES